jgi:antitoxin ParD1/3/4
MIYSDTNPAMEAKMSMVRKTISIPAQQDQWIKAQIAKGGYTNDSDLIRALIRQEQAKTNDEGVSDARKAQIQTRMKLHDATIQKLAR